MKTRYLVVWLVGMIGVVVSASACPMPAPVFSIPFGPPMLGNGIHFFKSEIWVTSDLGGFSCSYLTAAAGAAALAAAIGMFFFRTGRCETA